MTSTEIAPLRRLPEVVEEHDTKLLALEQTIKDFEAAGVKLREQSTIGGTWGNTQIDTGSIHASTLKASIVKSAWRHVYDGLNIKRIATAKDKKKFERTLEEPPEFTLENIRATFGDFLLDPKGNILRGLAEVFSDLDPAYKSHEKVKIGVDGLPKRIILPQVTGWGSYGRDKLENVINALAQYQNKPLVTHSEMEAIMKDGNALLKAATHKDYNRNSYEYEDKEFPARGIWLKRFSNGNGHLFFDKDTLKDVNRALAEYYGEVLPDCAEEKPTKTRASTAVSKDLQYYPTPQAVIDIVMADVQYYVKDGAKVLEPSCGCGRFLDAIKKAGGKPFGIEVDGGRVQQCRNKGYNVMMANFLDTEPEEKYDYVVMNPPFYGQHYAKHVEHAYKYLKPGGCLKAILPITARYDHKLLDHHTKNYRDQWSDLPIGSFRESGTNINTTVLTIWKPEK